MEVATEAEPRWLGTVEEVPEYQRRPYILKFYRLEPPGMRHFWRLHNEFGNMWTHILAGALTAVRLLSWWRSTFGDQPSAVQPQTVPLLSMSWPRPLYALGVLMFFLGSLTTFWISVQYHWRHCGKEREVKCWLCLDISSCALLLLAGFLSGVPMGFHCYPTLQAGYLMQAALVCIVAVGALVSETKETRGERSTMALILCGISATWPALHWLVICTQGREVAGNWLVLVIILGSAASFLYSRHIPECYAPGCFDLACSSHQFWHVLIYGAIAAYTEALVAVFALTDSPSYCDAG